MENRMSRLTPLKLTLIISSLLSINLAYAQTTEETLLKELAQTKSDSVEQIKLLTPRAEAGNPLAQLELGQAYWELKATSHARYGDDLYANSVKWLSRAADQQQNKQAQNEAVEQLARTFHYFKAPKELETLATNTDNPTAQYWQSKTLLDADKAIEAMTWAEKSAAQGYAEAEMLLLTQYADTWSKAYSPKKAVEWSTRLAEKGNLAATEQLAGFYWRGFGDAWPEFEVDQGKAISLHQKAAGKGHAPSLIFIGDIAVRHRRYDTAGIVANMLIEQDKHEGHYLKGRLLVNGWGRDVDKQQALFHFKKAADAGNFGAEGYVEMLEKELNP